MIAPAMRNDRRLSGSHSDKPPYWMMAVRAALQTTIGQELRARYEVSQDLPPEMLALLVQLNDRRED
jgi:hypothetical protein